MILLLLIYTAVLADNRPLTSDREIFIAWRLYGTEQSTNGHLDCSVCCRVEGTHVGPGPAGLVHPGRQAAPVPIGVVPRLLRSAADHLSRWIGKRDQGLFRPDLH